jgi:RND family efflux transporter MFP subunit
MMNFSPKLFLAVVTLVLCQSAHSQQPAALAPSGQSSAQGVLSPWKICRVSCTESGLVKELYVSPGKQVKVGDKLGVLDTDQQEVLVLMAKIHAKATGKVESARAEVNLNERRLAAIEAGRKTSSTTQSEVERVEMELRISRGKLANELDQFQVDQLNLRKLETQMQQRTISAPINGTVVRMIKEVGEFVAPTSPEILEIVDTSKLRATFFLSSDEVVRISKVDKSQIQLDGRQIVDAELEYVAPIADAASGLIEVRMLIPNPSQHIGSGCSLLLDSTKSVKQQT